MSIDDKVNLLWKDMYGNERDGLVVKVTRVETTLKMQMRADAEFRAWIKKQFFVVILLAVCAGASPWAGRLIDWFTKLSP